MKKIGIVFIFVLLICAGCGKAETVKTYRQSEKEGILTTYYEMKDGTWKCDNTIYQHRLELRGTMPNAEGESCYVILTDNEKLDFEDVSKSLYGSLLEDSKVMEGSVIVEMNVR